MGSRKIAVSNSRKGALDLGSTRIKHYYGAYPRYGERSGINELISKDGLSYKHDKGTSKGLEDLKREGTVSTYPSSVVAIVELGTYRALWGWQL